MMSLLTALMLSLPVSGAQGGAVELDRVLSTVHATKVWRSDVRQARLLKLCPPATTDEAILAALENRLLMMAEVGRSPQPYDPPLTRSRITGPSGKAGWAAPT
jgi:hypothetical protein